MIENLKRSLLRTILTSLLMMIDINNYTLITKVVSGKSISNAMLNHAVDELSIIIVYHCVDNDFYKRYGVLLSKGFLTK